MAGARSVREKKTFRQRGWGRQAKRWFVSPNSKKSAGWEDQTLRRRPALAP